MMRRSSRRVLLRRLVLAALLLLPLAGAAPAPVRFQVEMADDGFHVEGEDGANPVLYVEPGTHVDVSVVNVGSKSQDFHVGAPVNRSTPFGTYHR